MGESAPPIIFAKISKLRSHITSLNSRQMLVGASIPKLDNKHTDPIIVRISIVIFDNNFSKNSREVCIPTQVSGPPFRGSHAWSMQNEAI